MDDVSKLGPLWVRQLESEVARRRNAATESLLTIDPEGDFAKQHLTFIAAANATLAAPLLVAALKDCLAFLENDCPLDSPCGAEIRQARAALTAAGA